MYLQAAKKINQLFKNRQNDEDKPPSTRMWSAKSSQKLEPHMDALSSVPTNPINSKCTVKEVKQLNNYGAKKYNQQMNYQKHKISI